MADIDWSKIPTPRIPVGIAMDRTDAVVVCNDGTVWYRSGLDEWTQRGHIPDSIVDIRARMDALIGDAAHGVALTPEPLPAPLTIVPANNADTIATAAPDV